MAQKQKIRRSKFALFLDTAPGTDSPVWELIGDGVTEMSISYNPQTSEVIYVNEDSGSTDVESYKPTIAAPMTALAGDPVFEFVDELRIGRKVLSECETNCLMVYLYKPEQTGKYPAERSRCTVQVDEFGGAGGESTKLNFTLNLCGDAQHGLFDPASKTFTPAD